MPKSSATCGGSVSLVAEWRTATLDEVVSLQRGHELSEKLRRPGRVPVLGSFGVTGYHDEAIVKGPGVTVGRAGASFGVAAFVAEDYWPINTCLYATDFRGNDPRFVYYLLRSLRDELQSHNSGSAQPMLNRNYIKKIEVNLPPRDEQREISSLIGRIDDKLQSNGEMNRTLEAMARALFRSWFVDFDPVRAKIEGRPTGLPDEVAALFPAALTASSVGDVPQGWGLTKMDTAFEILSGGTPRREVEAYWKGDIPWFSVRDCASPSDVFTIRTGEHITQSGVDNSAAQILPAGTTIITARGTVGKLTITGVPMAMNQSCFGLRWGDGSAPTFGYYSVSNAVGSLQEKVTGSVFDTINRSTFATTAVLVPPPALVAAFEEQAGPLLARVKLNCEQSQTLGALRDALLPKLLSGEIRIPVEARA